jgi:hypothetical protein
MSKCLYCQQDNPAREVECRNCGMPLPTSAKHADQRRFLWFCIGLTAFCVLMIVWLPRTIS